MENRKLQTIEKRIRMKVQEKLVYCLRMGKPYCVTQDQYLNWFTDNASAFIIEKSEWQKLKDEKVIYYHQDITVQYVDRGFPVGPEWRVSKGMKAFTTSVDPLFHFKVDINQGRYAEKIIEAQYKSLNIALELYFRLKFEEMTEDANAGNPLHPVFQDILGSFGMKQ